MLSPSTHRHFTGNVPPPFPHSNTRVSGPLPTAEASALHGVAHPGARRLLENLVQGHLFCSLPPILSSFFSVFNFFILLFPPLFRLGIWLYFYKKVLKDSVISGESNSLLSRKQKVHFDRFGKSSDIRIECLDSPCRWTIRRIEAG